MVISTRVLLLVATLVAGCSSGGPGQSTPDAAAPGTPDGGGPVCQGDPCDLFEQCGCAAGEACALDGSDLASGATTCRPVTAGGQHGDPCEGDEQCAAGYGCMGTCREYCETDADCLADSFCLLPVTDGGGGDAVPGVKMCTAVCKPQGKTDNGCPAAQACDLYQAPSGELYSECHPPGAGGEGDDCSGYGDCQAGFSCIAFSPTFEICTQLCPVIGDDPYMAPQTCDGDGICRPFADPRFLGDQEYGACAP